MLGGRERKLWSLSCDQAQLAVNKCETGEVVPHLEFLFCIMPPNAILRAFLKSSKGTETDRQRQGHSHHTLTHSILSRR